MSVAIICVFACRKFSKSSDSFSSSSASDFSEFSVKTGEFTESEFVFKIAMSLMLAFTCPIEISLFNPANTA